MTYKFTKKAEKTIQIAKKIAIELGHNYVGTEHILYGLAKENTGIASKVLENQSITASAILEKIDKLIGKGVKLNDTNIELTPRTKRVFENAFREAKRLNSEYIGTEHLLIGIMREADSIAVRIMLELNLNPQKLYNDLIKVIDITEDRKNIEATGGYNSTPTLNQFGTDLTKSAREGKLDPVIDRQNEIERIIQTLSRRNKNNPCLIGEPGVGKTAIIEGLAERIISGDVPENIKEKRLVTLDISGMVAGAKYRGDFEERIKKALKEVTRDGNIIIFIDEIHTIVGAGAAEGAIDAANILKPLLARGEIQVIGATTINEYRKHIEKDSALERRFQPILVNEPSEEDTIKILQGLREKYEKHHNVKITDAAIDAATKLSARYVNDRFLPDKAIDLLDEAAARVKLKSSETNKVKNNKTVKCVAEDDILEVISIWTGIPLNKLSQDENNRLRNLENNIHQRVVGQNEAVSALSKAIKRSRVGLQDPNKPIGSFMFLGPTGVGKTELAKALSESLFGDENLMIRVDMSEYMESHSTAKMIGSPPGYVGFDEAGGLTEKVRRKPYSVILFDEIEKAHPDVLNVLLQILDDGRLTDSHGRVVNFKNTVIIMTSNIGARLITEKKTLGFTNSNNTQEYETTKKEVITELKKQFKPEFVNRIDEIIVFHKLTDDEIKQIADIMINKVVNRLKNKNIELIVDDSAKDLIIKKGMDSKYGARPLKRAIQTMLEDRIAEEIINGKIKPGDKTTISASEEEIIIKYPQ